MNRTDTANPGDVSRSGESGQARAAAPVPIWRRRLADWGCAAAAALLFAWLVTEPLSAGAKQTTRSVAIGATVQPYARLNATNPIQLVILNKDTSGGSMTVPNKSNPAGTTLAVQTNDRAGYVVLVQVSAAAQAQFSSIEIIGFGKTVVLPPTGGTVSIPYSALNTTFNLSYRFVFAPKAKDGTYPWPITFSAQPNP